MQYTSRFLQLVEYERSAEIEQCRQEILRLTPEERRARGKCEFYFKGYKAPSVFHYTVVKFIKPCFIRTKIGVGDLVLISRGKPAESELTGTVTQAGGNTIMVAFDSAPPKWAYQNHIRIDLYSNDVPYRRMQDNLRWFMKVKHPLKSLILGERESYPAKPVTDFEPLNEHLNISQKQAVAAALGTKDIFLIHGPPGTGKTTTLTEIICQAVMRRKRVLATAESNTAADNMLMKLAQYDNLRIVRLGHPARIMAGYEDYSLHAHFQDHPLYEAYISKLDNVKEMRAAQKKFQKPTPKMRHGMSDEEIIHKARKRRGGKGVRGKDVCSMYGWIKRDKIIQDKSKTLKEIEQQMFDDILSQADVVVSTNCMAGYEKMIEQYFDLAVIDEGSQQVEPSTLIPLLKARRCIIAGDHKQLPPTIISEKAQELKHTLFARLKENFPHNVSMLTIQYRMHEGILSYPRRKFYDDKLCSGESIGSRTLADLVPHASPDQIAMLAPDRPVVFRDTSAEGDLAYEFKKEKAVSFENKLEAEWVQQIIDETIESGIDPSCIGVITPYQGQVQLLKKMLQNQQVEVDSIDGFQGREKEMIILSLVRANGDGNVGFLQDLRRLNVAITRAKRKLIVVAHGNTLKTNAVYLDWLEDIEKANLTAIS